MNLSLSPRRLLSSRRALLAGAFCAAACLAQLAAPQSARAQTSPWTPVDYSINLINTAGSNRVMWKSTNGTYALWKINATGGIDKGLSLTPASGFTFKKIVHNSQGETIILWDAPAKRQIDIWHVSPELVIDNKKVINYPTGDYALGSIAVYLGPQISWVAPNGSWFFWNLDASTGNITNTSAAYGPYTNLKPGIFAIASDQRISMTLTNTVTNQTTIQIIPGTYGAATATHTYGPYSGATLQGIAWGSDNNLRLMWGYTNGKVALWKVPPTTWAISNSATYGPIAGVTAVGMGVDGNLNPHLLWKYTTGKAALWTIAPALSPVVAGYTYGPLK